MHAQSNSPVRSLFIRKFVAAHFSASQVWVLLTCVLLSAYLALILATFSDYGITYDEDWHHIYGEYIVQWYASGFTDTQALTFWNLIYKGGFFDVLLALVSKLPLAGIYEASHLLNALLGWLGVIGAYKLGRFLAGPLAGFLSAFFLIMTPRYYGHAFNNPIDLPVAALSIFVIYYLVRVLYSLPRPPKMLIIKLGLALGLTLGIRVGLVILVGYIGLAFGLWFAHRYWRSLAGGQPFAVRSVLFQLAGVFLGTGALAYGVMLLFWPAAQVDPLRHPLRSLWRATHFEYPFKVFFDGEFILNSDLPWYYLLKWFWITLPEFYFVALAAGLFLTGRFIWRFRQKATPSNPNQLLGSVILLTAALFPLAYAAVTTPVDYDGIRHFLFVVPLLAVIAAVSVAGLAERRVPVPVLVAVVAVILASAGVTAVDMIQLHPSQYIYFNRSFGGGVAQAAQSFETDYWGNSFKEGVEWVVKNYKNHSGDRRIKVASCLYSLSTSYFLPADRFEYVGSFHDGQRIPDGVKPDLFLATSRWGCDKTLPGEIIHTVSRQGAPLLYVIEVD